ncbi:MAG: protein-export chaperone SecB [Micavibrio sp.]|nr:protein-export chaperone SecB [Micavibrio sp.]
MAEEQNQDQPINQQHFLNVLAQYVKDLSFENTNAPDSLRAGQGQPEMDIKIGMDARKIPHDKIPFLYEVVLNLNATATRGEKNVFIAELQYGATVEIKDVPEDKHHPILLIEIPTIIFPFARQIISDVTMQGGYPPLMLNPIDFQSLYMDRYEDEILKSLEEKEAETEQ